MAPEALVLSHDAEVLRTVGRVLSDLGMRVELCTTAERASEWVERRKFDVTVVDVDGTPGGAAVLHEIRQSPSNRDTAVFAILGGITSPQRAFQMGANLSLQKPLSMDRAVRSFRAANVLIAGERRRYYRHPVEMPVVVTVGTTEIQAKATTVSEGGMAIQVRHKLEAGSTLQVRFKLPGSKMSITSNAVVAWADTEGRVGLRFEDLPASAHEEFARWAAERGKRQDSEAPATGAISAPPGRS